MSENHSPEVQAVLEAADNEIACAEVCANCAAYQPKILRDGITEIKAALEIKRHAEEQMREIRGQEFPTLADNLAWTTLQMLGPWPEGSEFGPPCKKEPEP